MKAPLDVGAAPEGPEAAAGRVEQDPVEGLPEWRAPAVGCDTVYALCLQSLDILLDTSKFFRAGVIADDPGLSLGKLRDMRSLSAGRATKV